MSDGDGSTVGVYGKVRAQPDFLRANAGEFSQAGLDLWFQEAMEALRSEGTQLPETPTNFLLTTTKAPSTAFLGVFAPSADAASRSFPLAVFRSLALRELVDAFPSATSAYAPFVGEAAMLAFMGADLAGPELVARVQALGARGEGRGDVATGDDTVQPLLGALGGAPAVLGYALRTFMTACDQAQKTGPAGRSGVVVTVDAPAPNAASRAFWLELARRRLRWRDAIPSLLWTDGPAGRLLMTLGYASSTALSYLANPRHRASRFWPLRTDVPTAIDSAMNALTPEQRRRVENPRSTLGELLSSFA
ncbi:MAG TPA: type VI secretion system-associated protein TagF [Polyangia bacterium]|jgi:type VI secretion system ImpM family protein